jgi:hypothetical protein
MKKLLLLTLAFAPSIAFAQSGQLGNLDQLVRAIGRLVGLALPIVVAIGLLVFMWGLVRFIFGGAENKDQGKALMIWGLVALFVMVSVWGLVRFIGDALGVQQGQTIIVPSVPNLPQ